MSELRAEVKKPEVIYLLQLLLVDTTCAIRKTLVLEKCAARKLNSRQRQI